MDITRIINDAAFAGKIILENGAEIYRVEDTIVRICNAYGIKKVDTFVTTNIIIVCASDEYDRTITIVRRIKQRTINLEKISQVNDVSRHIKDKGHTLEYVENKLDRINNIRPYSNKITLFFSGLVAGFFTLVFGGNLRDFLVSFIIGILIRLTYLTLNLVQTNEFLINTLSGALTALIALSSVYFHIGVHSDKIIVGSIMLLVPGIAITNAIRDTIAGDIISGSSRAIEAILIASAIALGTGIILKLWFIILGGV
ncbi:threonine/serine exporter [Clostridium fermenticellae]|uniref:Threonine/serine exporter n=1 Tax=Clostridium fermenticellae TaxID=2068654 RepID=A0A386H5U6_9CLOT|nr:threonine/serine exporter family protein [Clostridium fermenticellae]AYD40938.1 threonine/serine exporter [Clostridium fermenticellae]